MPKARVQKARKKGWWEEPCLAPWPPPRPSGGAASAYSPGSPPPVQYTTHTWYHHIVVLTIQPYRWNTNSQEINTTTDVTTKFKPNKCDLDNTKKLFYYHHYSRSIIPKLAAPPDCSALWADWAAVCWWLPLVASLTGPRWSSEIVPPVWAALCFCRPHHLLPGRRRQGRGRWCPCWTWTPRRGNRAVSPGSCTPWSLLL